MIDIAHIKWPAENYNEEMSGKDEWFIEYYYIFRTIFLS